MMMPCSCLLVNGEVQHVLFAPDLQVRQHTGHKRTFFYLEQLILKYNVDQQCISIKEMHEVSPGQRHILTALHVS